MPAILPLLPKVSQKSIIDYAKFTPTRSTKMATYRTRKNAWRVEVSRNGIRKSASFDTKAQAKAWAAKVETDIDAEKFGNVGTIKTVADAFERYANEVSVEKRVSVMNASN